MLKVYLFGSPRIEKDGIAIHIGRRKSLALFAYLAATRIRHHRDKLATLLWPDLNQRAARTALRRDLATVTSTIGKKYIDADRESVAIHPASPIWVDIEDFMEQEESGKVELDKRLADLRSALTIYQDEFMAGFSLVDCPEYDEWQFYQSEELRRRRADIFAEIIRHLTQHDDDQPALKYARQWVKADPLNESAYSALIQIYGQTGNITAAIRQFDACQSLFSRELGVPPSSKLAALIESLKHQSVLPDDQQVDSKPTTGSSVNPLASSKPDTLQPGLVSHTLPVPLTRLIGRDNERVEIRGLLQSQHVRLVTLTGPGGIGKTRLSIELGHDLADDYDDDVYFAQLATISEPDIIPAAIAQSLPFYEPKPKDPFEQLIDLLRKRQCLLIIDNFEHLVSGAHWIEALLENCARLKIMVTSREALHITGEYEYALQPLDLPQKDVSPSKNWADYSALALFIERIQQRKPSFVPNSQEIELAMDICRWLDGLPLAIELAAARTKLLSLSSLLQQLRGRAALNRIHSKSSTISDRHRSLYNTISWSYDLLPPVEQAIFRTLAVFSGGFTVQSAQKLCDITLDYGEINRELEGILESLLDKSLLQWDEKSDGNMRFSMLVTIRTFGMQQLDDCHGKTDVYRQYAAYFMELVEQAEPKINSGEQKYWLSVLDEEYDNIRAAIHWAQANDEIPVALRIVGALRSYWMQRAYYDEGSQRLHALVSHPEADNFPKLKAKCLLCLGVISIPVRSTADSKRLLHQSLQLGRTAHASAVVAYSLVWLASLDNRSGSDSQSRAYLNESLKIFQSIDDKWGEAFTLIISSYVAATEGQLSVEILNEGERGLALIQQNGDKFYIALAYLHLGCIHYFRGDYTEAYEQFERGLKLSREKEYNSRSGALLGEMGKVCIAQGKLDVALNHLTESLDILTTIGHKHAIANTLEGFAELAAKQGRWSKALHLTGAIQRDLFARNEVLPIPTKRKIDLLISMAQEELSPEGFKEAMDAGQKMGIDDATKVALV